MLSKYCQIFLWVDNWQLYLYVSIDVNAPMAISREIARYLRVKEPLHPLFDKIAASHGYYAKSRRRS